MGCGGRVGGKRLRESLLPLPLPPSPVATPPGFANQVRELDEPELFSNRWPILAERSNPVPNIVSCACAWTDTHTHMHTRTSSAAEHRARIAESIRSKWQDPDYRERTVAATNRVSAGPSRPELVLLLSSSCLLCTRASMTMIKLWLALIRGRW